MSVSGSRIYVVGSYSGKRRAASGSSERSEPKPERAMSECEHIYWPMPYTLCLIGYWHRVI